MHSSEIHQIRSQKPAFITKNCGGMDDKEKIPVYTTFFVSSLVLLLAFAPMPLCAYLSSNL